MSYRPMVCVHGEWAGNGLRFATKEEAETSVYLLANRWTLVDDWRADESDEPVNYVWVHGRGPVAKEVVAWA